MFRVCEILCNACMCTAGSVFFCYVCSRISALVPPGPRDAFLEVTLKVITVHVHVHMQLGPTARGILASPVACRQHCGRGLQFGARGALLGLGFASVKTVRLTDGDNDYVASNTQVSLSRLLPATFAGREA